MKASPSDFATFADYLRRLARFGNGQSKQEADAAAEILKVLDSAVAGNIGRRCACGSDGEYVRKVQPATTWPIEAHVVCSEHAKLIDQFQAFMKQILDENKK